MRCNRCGNELLENAVCSTCAKVSNTSKLKTVPRNNHRSAGSITGITNKFQSVLANIIAQLPLGKIKIPVWLLWVIMAVIPFTAIFTYLTITNQICLNCAEITGDYISEIELDNKTFRIELKLYQYGSALTGQIHLKQRLITEPSSTNINRNLTNPISEPIQQGSVAGNKLQFQTFIVDGKNPRFKFDGNIEETNIINGNLILTIPELNSNGRVIKFSLSKSK